jgi:hypothetical protein
MADSIRSALAESNEEKPAEAMELTDDAFVEDLLRHIDMFATYNRSRVDDFLNSKSATALGEALQLILENGPMAAATNSRVNESLLRRGNAPRVHMERRNSFARRGSKAERRMSSAERRGSVEQACVNDRVGRRSSFAGRRSSAARRGSFADRRGSNGAILDADDIDAVAAQIAMMYDEADSFVKPQTNVGSRTTMMSSLKKVKTRVAFPSTSLDHSSALELAEQSVVEFQSDSKLKAAKKNAPKSSLIGSLGRSITKRLERTSPSSEPKSVVVVAASSEPKSGVVVAASSEPKSGVVVEIGDVKSATNHEDQGGEGVAFDKPAVETGSSSKATPLISTTSDTTTDSAVCVAPPAETKDPAIANAAQSNTDGSLSTVTVGGSKSTNPSSAFKDPTPTPSQLHLRPISHTSSVVATHTEPRTRSPTSRSPSPKLFATNPVKPLASIAHNKTIKGAVFKGVESHQKSSTQNNEKKIVPIHFEEDEDEDFEEEDEENKEGMPLSSQVWVHPDSSLLITWRMMVPPLALFLSVFVPALLVFDDRSEQERNLFNCILEAILLFDVILQFEFLAFRDEFSMKIVAVKHAVYTLWSRDSYAPFLCRTIRGSVNGISCADLCFM